MRLAIDEGINFFDVSPYYGLTLAETRLGEALEGHRDKVVLATKCGRFGEDTFDFSAKRTILSVEESLQRLRTDYVDILQAHDVEFGDAQQIIEETIPAMRALQQAGKIRFVGITGYSLKNLMEIAEKAPVDSILTYCRYNLMISDMHTELIPFATKNNIGIINASSLHMGILTERGAPDWHPAPHEVRGAGKRIVDFCKERGIDASEVALRFCLEYPHVASTLIGMSTRKHVQASIQSLATRNDPSLIQQLQELIEPVYGYVWPSGRPENYG
ncbi:L-fuco-beta-pyranose dehydrogenase (plasmid) [Acidisarcina polymorpha]|uniref:L-fuco-beta-pyranose dehydrogenase n=1 Tax=Acidisarcina polymorpha TaxID=2211140 RepID=A0A2Z5GBI9_9BACT|nr:L-fuco-beta-pyranose dehydrogenase [Acidisarcina polymorpha]